MHITPALVAGFAAITSAFLVPPNFPDDFKDLRHPDGPPEHVKDFIHALLEQRTTVVELECPDCPVAGDNGAGGVVWQQGIESTIHLEFKTNGEEFLVNDYILLPVESTPPAHSRLLKAHQNAPNAQAPPVDVTVSYAMELLTPVPTLHEEGVSFIPVEFTVLGLDGIPIKANTLSFKIIRVPNGDLVIVNHDEIPFEHTPGADICEGTRPWSLCRIRAMIMSRIKSLLETAARKTDKVHNWLKEKTHLSGGDCNRKGNHKGNHKGKGKGNSKDHPHHRGGFWRHGPPHADSDHPHPHSWHKDHKGPHHDRHGSHQSFHHVATTVHQTIRFLIIPALLGVVGGLIACGTGMLFGQAIVFLWVRTYRRGRRGPLRVVERREVAVERDEKDQLLLEEEEGEHLPMYEDEDVPRYEDAVDGVGLRDEK